MGQTELTVGKGMLFHPDRGAGRNGLQGVSENGGESGRRTELRLGEEFLAEFGLFFLHVLEVLVTMVVPTAEVEHAVDDVGE